MPPKGNKNSSIQKLQREIRNLRSTVQGCVLRIPIDPSSVVINPWHITTVVATLPIVDVPGTPVSFTGTVLRNAIIAQNWLQGSTGYMIFRLLEVRLWGSPGGRIQGVVLSGTQSSSLYSTFDDTGNLTGRPKFGYKWPSAISTFPINPATSGNIYQLTINSGSVADDTGICHISVLWRYESPD